MLVATILFRLPRCTMRHASLPLAITMLEYFSRTSADSGVLSVRSFLAPILVRQANVEYISTANEQSAHHQAISSIVIMHAWRCATSRRGHREV